MKNDLFDAVRDGATVLTVNKRLARHLLQGYDQAQAASGLTVWPAAQILSLDAWILRQFHKLDSAATLLSDPQSQYLWEEIVAADAAAVGRDLLQRAQTAGRAREAHRLLTAYLADIRESEAEEDHLAFLRWRRQWEARRRAGNYLDRADLLPIVTAAIAGGTCQAPSRLILAGFDDLTPAARSLCAAIEQHGGSIERWDPLPFPAASAVRQHAADMAEEVRWCARWVRWQLERNPGARIGVVVPNLSEYQGLLERTFRAELTPSDCLSLEDGPGTVAFSLGTPLASEGVVVAALRLLAVQDSLSLDEMSWLLRSPYLGGSRVEAAARARADRDLRARRRCEWRLASLAKVLNGVPRMTATLAALGKGREGVRKRLPGEWAEHFAMLLEGCGWPGDRGIGSREYQAVDHFKELLGQLAALDLVAAPLTRGEALSTLTRLASEAVFQPEGGEGGPRVLGMLEAAGFDFDALWVLGLHERAFPAPPRPHPFLPLHLQSRLRMPHADAGRELEFAQRLMARLLTSAPEVIVSWPGQLDGAPLRSSSLLRSLPDATLPLLPGHDPFQALQAASCPLEEVLDDHAAPLATLKPFTGGTNILTDQALCPFRAFTHHRLLAGKLDSADIGLDGMARGSLVHGVLERFWKQVRTRAGLLALDASRLDSLLATAAEEALTAFERRAHSDLPPKLRELELRRLTKVAAGWLELERKRPPFRVVEIEQRHEAAVGSLRLRTRVDRIDELDNGQLAIIDYKTGEQGPSQWLDRRVTEPQLPLYCLELDDARIGAVLFASVRSREKDCTFRGLARMPDDFTGMSQKSQEKLLSKSGLTDFDAAVEHWRNALPALGDAFVGGVATVDPVDQRKACNTCDLHGLCRVDERGVAAGDDEEGEGDE